MAGVDTNWSFSDACTSAPHSINNLAHKQLFKTMKIMLMYPKSFKNVIYLTLTLCLNLTGSALGMDCTGLAVWSSHCLDNNGALMSLTSATICWKFRSMMAKMMSSKMWYVIFWSWRRYLFTRQYLLSIHYSPVLVPTSCQQWCLNYVNVLSHLTHLGFAKSTQTWSDHCYIWMALACIHNNWLEKLWIIPSTVRCTHSKQFRKSINLA